MADANLAKALYAKMDGILPVISAKGDFTQQQRNCFPSKIGSAKLPLTCCLAMEILSASYAANIAALPGTSLSRVGPKPL